MNTTSRSRAQRHQIWLEQIDTVLRAQGMARAAPLALQALADGVEHPTLLNLAASVRFGEGRFDEAAALLRRARALAPRDPHILNSLGICLNTLGQPEAALQAFDAALGLDPAMAVAHFNRGTALEGISQINEARASHERAAALDHSYIDPLARLAWLDVEAGDAASARAHGERALALSPSSHVAQMALAFADVQQRQLAAAEQRLSKLDQDPGITSVNRSIVLGLIADLRDAEDRRAEAFAAYQASNAQLKAVYEPQYAAPATETALGRVRRLASWFEAADPEPWKEAPIARPRASDPKVHVFLVGFPRSGTTLLDNVLAAHPDVVSLEEKDCLEPALATFLNSNEGTERLAHIGSGDALRQRDSYWSKVRSFGIEPRGRVFIDKLPLASVYLPVIAKLFPNARILFARRDPRDVVLSCFRRRFGMNPSMYQLLTLEGAAEFYDAVMQLSELYRRILPLPQHVVRYESLVGDFEGTTRAACDFLGLEWDEAMRDFAAKARARGISTPSAAQVARGLNREGQGTWRRYREQMAPVLPLLEPWVEHFGYATS